MSSLLLQATTTTTLLLFLLLSPPTTTADIALDFEGNPLVAGAYYYAMPIVTQKGGGLTMFNKGPIVCPYFVAARSTKGDTEFGIPIRFDPQTRGHNKNIYVSSNVNIAFKHLSAQPLCRRRYTTVWTVSTDTASENGMVVLNGEESLFKLEEYGDQLSGGYKILAKEKTLLYDEQVSGEVLLSLDRGNPLLVVFVKA